MTVDGIPCEHRHVHLPGSTSGKLKRSLSVSGPTGGDPSVLNVRSVCVNAEH